MQDVNQGEEADNEGPPPRTFRLFGYRSESGVVVENGATCTGRGIKYGWTVLCDMPIERGTGMQSTEILYLLTRKEGTGASIGMASPSSSLDWTLGYNQQESACVWDSGSIFYCGKKQSSGSRGFKRGDVFLLSVDTDAPGDLTLVVTLNGEEYCSMGVPEGWCFGVGGHKDHHAFCLLAARAAFGAVDMTLGGKVGRIKEALELDASLSIPAAIKAANGMMGLEAVGGLPTQADALLQAIGV
jgi:hypothetical protein